MTTLFIIVSVFSILLSVVVKPKWAALLVWPVLFLYPHAFWYAANPLPMNIGFDDLFILFSAAVVVLRLNLGRREPLRFTWPVKIALAYLAMVIFCSVAGTFQFGINLQVIGIQIREILKVIVFVSLAYLIVNSIDDYRDLRRVATWFIFSIFLAAVLVILSAYFPQVSRVFASPIKAELMAYQVEAGAAARVAGSLAEPNTVGVVMAICSGLATYFILTSQRLMKLVYLAGTLLMVVAVMLAQSRVGFFGLGLALVLLLFFRGLRKSAFVVGLLVLGLLPLFPAVAGKILERIALTFVIEQGRIGVGEGGVSGRFAIWELYLSQVEPYVFLLGQGRIASLFRLQGTPHNGFLALLVFYGVWGLVWLGAVLYGFATRIRDLYRHRYLSEQWPLWGRTMIIYVIIMMACMVPTDPLAPGSYGLIIFLLMAGLLERALFLARQHEFYLAYEAELYEHGGEGLPA